MTQQPIGTWLPIVGSRSACGAGTPLTCITLWAPPASVACCISDLSLSCPGCSSGPPTAPFHMPAQPLALDPVLQISALWGPRSPGIRISNPHFHSSLQVFLKTLNLRYSNRKPQLCLQRSLRKWNMFQSLRSPRLNNQKTRRSKNLLQPKRLTQLRLQCPKLLKSFLVYQGVLDQHPTSHGNVDSSIQQKSSALPQLPPAGSSRTSFRPAEGPSSACKIICQS